MKLKTSQKASAVVDAQNKLWKLASNPFSVLGEARVADDRITLACLGDIPPEVKLGLAPGSFPTTIEKAMAMMHPDDMPDFRRTMERSLFTGEAFDLVYRLSDGRGGWRWIEGRAVPVKVHRGRYVSWVFFNRDFTAQREMELSLRVSVQELESSRTELRSEKEKLWRLAANAFSVLGEAYVTDKNITLFFFGDEPPESKIGMAPGTVGQNIEEVIKIMHPDDVQGYRKKLEHSVATGEPFRHIYRLADGRGGWRWLEVRALSLEKRDGKHNRWLHDNRDVTEQKELEEALRKTVAELQRLKGKLQVENQFLRQEAGMEVADTEIVGLSPALGRVLEQVDLVASTSSTVLISGETGTGKELVARAIHQRSDRKKGLFVPVNCAALPGTLVESELFGHEKGAFTGAIARRIGRFEQADGGTLFLDEVGELSLETQAKMLRVLQSGEFERVGGGRSLKTDVRVVAATNRNLEQAVREGRFRSDLYHRLAIFPIQLPPLRERREDIPLLAAYLITRKAHRMGRKIDQISDAILDRLAAYDWPGNVRELENVLERAIILSPETVLRLDAIQLGASTEASVQERKPANGVHAVRDIDFEETDHSLEARERAHILRICQMTAWKIKGPGGAAEKLRINPGTLYARMKKLGIRRTHAVSRA